MAKHPRHYDRVQRRIRAAMSIAGVTFPDLATRIAANGMTNMGSDVLRKLSETGDRDGKNVALRGHLLAIAEGCELPYEWFTVDFNRLPELEQPAEPGQTVIDDLAEQLRELREEVQGLKADVLILGAEASPQTGEAAATKPDRVQPEKPQ